MAPGTQMQITSPQILGDPSPFEATVERDGAEDGVEILRLHLACETPSVPPPLSLEWRQPLIDGAALWTTGAGRAKALPPSWAPLRFSAKATSEAPLLALVSAGGGNRFTIACADALHVVEFEVGIVEETAEMCCRLTLFSDPPEPSQRLEVTFRVDRRDVRYERALAETRSWWEEDPSCRPSSVPEAARSPMYSTWYAFHQLLDPQAVEEECRRARELGCEAVLIDDGWQTLDASRGYAFTGDWEPERIPALGEHVARLHALGMRVILWYSVPFVGVKSRAYQRFGGRFLYEMEERGAAILDPRYPEVRDYLIGTWERAISTWNLDGLKLDFVDRFKATADAPRGAGDGRDHGSVMDAVDRLLGDAMLRLRQVRPDVLIEFRQPYIGPLMRRYGNLFRANDCPTDHVRNRISVLDLRLLAGDTACHGDMLMWHPAEPAESAALQLLAVLFAVPQLSVRLADVPDDHLDMLRFWLDFWCRRRDTLLCGELRATSPELAYPLAWAKSRDELVAATYAEVVVPIERPAPRRIYLVNATRGDAVTIAIDEPLRRQVCTRDCRGRVVGQEERALEPGVHRFQVPPAGLVTLE